MMQPCVSAAKLRCGGSILETGAEGHGLLRITTTSDRYRQFVARNGRVPFPYLLGPRNLICHVFSLLFVARSALRVS